MRGAPHSGFSMLIRRIRARNSASALPALLISNASGKAGPETSDRGSSGGPCREAGAATPSPDAEAMFSAPSRPLDLNGKLNTATTKQISVSIAPDVRRIHHLINLDKVFGTHTHLFHRRRRACEPLPRGHIHGHNGGSVLTTRYFLPVVTL
jgi:hypothetical protein